MVRSIVANFTEEGKKEASFFHLVSFLPIIFTEHPNVKTVNQSSISNA